MADSSRGLGSAVVIFYVGKEQHQVSIHQKRLCAKSLIFEKAFNHPATPLVTFLRQAVDVDVEHNPTNGGIRLPFPKFEVKAMSTLVEYIYTDSLPEDMDFGDLYYLFEVASRFEMPELMNLILDHIQELQVACGEMLSMEAIATIYEHRYLGQGRLWEYCLSSIAGALFWGDVEAEWAANFRTFCSNNPRITTELIEFQLAFGKQIHKTELQRRKPVKGQGFDSCQFHVHHDGTECEAMAAKAVGPASQHGLGAQTVPLTKKQKKALQQVGLSDSVIQGGKVTKKTKKKGIHVHFDPRPRADYGDAAPAARDSPEIIVRLPVVKQET